MGRTYEELEGCGHERNFTPPLKDRPKLNGRTLRPEDIICWQCVEKERKEFYARLRKANENAIRKA